MAPDSPPKILVWSDRQQDLTVVTVEGQVSAEQIRSQIVGFLTGEPTQFVLWDIRNGSLKRLSADAVRMLVSAGAPHADRRRGGRTAIVCGHDLDFGLSRMFQAIAELHHLPFEIDVFRDIDAAVAWLGVEMMPG